MVYVINKNILIEESILDHIQRNKNAIKNKTNYLQD